MSIRPWIARALLAVSAGAVSLQAQVTFDRILRAGDEPQNWLTYSGSVLSQRYSTLTQITPGNVENLEQQWVFQAQIAREVRGHAAGRRRRDVHRAGAERRRGARRGDRPRLLGLLVQPLAAGAAVLRPRQSRPGDPRQHAVHGNHRRPPGRHRRHDGRPGLERHRRGRQARGGLRVHARPARRQGQGDRRRRRAASTASAASSRPSTHEPARRCGASTRFPGPASAGTRRGRAIRGSAAAAPIWVTGSYDPDLNLTYWGIGNPGPDWNGDSRAGDNLYSESVVALDADTGQLKWHFQFTPHDEFDYDSMQVPVLADIRVAGPIAQGDAVGQPQRLLLRARPHDRGSSCPGSRSSR